ncbi:hypothetical protein GCM10020220_065180 [Nonomuraea rubra]
MVASRQAQRGRDVRGAGAVRHVTWICTELPGRSKCQRVESQPHAVRVGYYVSENCGHHVNEAETMDLVVDEEG